MRDGEQSACWQYARSKRSPRAVSASSRPRLLLTAVQRVGQRLPPAARKTRGHVELDGGQAAAQLSRVQE